MELLQKKNQRINIYVLLIRTDLFRRDLINLSPGERKYFSQFCFPPSTSSASFTLTTLLPHFCSCAIYLIRAIHRPYSPFPSFGLCTQTPLLTFAVSQVSSQNLQHLLICYLISHQSEHRSSPLSLIPMLPGHSQVQRPTFSHLIRELQISPYISEELDQKTFKTPLPTQMILCIMVLSHPLTWLTYIVLAQLRTLWELCPIPH